MADSVRIFPVDYPHLPRTVRMRLLERQKELVNQILATSDWDDFQQRRGKILGLQEAIDICTELEKDQRES